MKITVVVCTHNRADLLDRLLQSLVAADGPDEGRVEMLVIANACSDHTREVLSRWASDKGDISNFSIRWTEEPQRGKSHALNKALELLNSDVAVFIDDDHRVDSGFLCNIEKTLRENPSVNLFCGRILPDWDGREPDWVHDDGRYRLFPPPMPVFDKGDVQRFIENERTKPGGGNLIIRRGLLSRLGLFSTDLGPQGHDLGGGEDSEYLQRALNQGERLLYVPEILQHHYVDLSRLQLSDLLRMSYQRSRASARVHYGGTGARPCFWRKLVEYVLSAVFSLSFRRTRFYLVRIAAVLGEIRGLREIIDSAEANK